MPPARRITRIISRSIRRRASRRMSVDDRLCLAGLSFNATYNVTLKTGLPAATGEKLTDGRNRPGRAARQALAGALRRRHHPAARQCRRRAGHHRQYRQAAAEGDPRRRPAAVADRKRHGRRDHALFLERQRPREQPGRAGVEGHDGRRQRQERYRRHADPDPRHAEGQAARRLCADRDGRAPRSDDQGLLRRRHASPRNGWSIPTSR